MIVTVALCSYVGQCTHLDVGGAKLLRQKTCKDTAQSSARSVQTLSIPEQIKLTTLTISDRVVIHSH